MLLKNRPVHQQSLTIFDVGANEGQFLKLVLKHLQGQRMKVVCFEPAQAAFHGLCNKFPDIELVTLENMALDDHAHRGDIYYEAQKSLRASKYPRDLRHLGVDFSLSETVEFTTLDVYCATHQIEQIDLLKLDVEGNEYNVLLGAESMLTNQAIGLVTFEFGRAQVDSRVFFKDIYYFLEKHGMRSLYRIFPNGYLKPIEHYDEAFEVFFPTNYLAVIASGAQANL